MSDYGDGDEEYGEWMYVEDYWDEANELAEHTCPSPVPSFELVPDDYDVHDYWQDIEYLSDGGYYEDHQSPSKRKMATKSSQRPNKRRRRAAASSSETKLGAAPIAWMTQAQREKTQNHAPLVTSGNAQPIALLKDWDQRFKDTPGLASFPKSDLDLNAADSAVSGDGFDLADLQSVAGLLSEENIGTLQEILRAKGLDPDAVQAVLQDLVAGNEPDFDDDDDGDDEENNSDEEMSEHLADQTEMNETDAGFESRLANTTAKAKDTGITATRHPRAQEPSMQPQPASSERRPKRKGRPDDGSADLSDDGPTTRKKRHKAKPLENELTEETSDLSMHMSNGTGHSEKLPGSSRPLRSTNEVPEDSAPRTRSGRVRRR